MVGCVHVRQEGPRNKVMARDTQSIVKMSRREGYALHPKAHKVLVKRTGPPGQQGNKRMQRAKSTQYGIQLREKQKVKRLYGLLERQFRKLMQEAMQKKGQTGQILLEFLELRLDNVVYRSGLAMSRRASRQLVSHGHFCLNGKRVDIPSIRTKLGDVIELRPKSTKNNYFSSIDDISPVNPDTIPDWLKVNRKKFTITVNSMPTRETMDPDINEQLIIEYYSR